jgi:hypothetical protein
VAQEGVDELDEAGVPADGVGDNAPVVEAEVAQCR